MHLTSEEVAALIGVVVALGGAAAAWLRASAAHKAAGRAERKANQALNGTAGGQAGGSGGGAA